MIPNVCELLAGYGLPAVGEGGQDDEQLPDASGGSSEDGAPFKDAAGASGEGAGDAGGTQAKHFTRSEAKRTRQRLNAMLGPQVYAEYSRALNRLLRSPEGHKSLGMSYPPHSIEHTPFSEQIRSWTIAATSQDLSNG